MWCVSYDQNIYIPFSLFYYLLQRKVTKSIFSKYKWLDFFNHFEHVFAAMIDWYADIIRHEIWAY